MAATASAREQAAGRRSRERQAARYDTALTASWHGLRGERTPAAQEPSHDVRGRRSRVVLASGSWRQALAAMWRPTGPRIARTLGVTGARVHRSPGRARRTPFQPSRREGRATGPPVVHPVRVLQHTRDFGCQPAPGLPCALVPDEGGNDSKARAKQAARSRSHVDRQNIHRKNIALVPRTQRSASSRRAAEPGRRERLVLQGWVPAWRHNAGRVAACRGHETGRSDDAAAPAANATCLYAGTVTCARCRTRTGTSPFPGSSVPGRNSSRHGHSRPPHSARRRYC